MAVPAGTGERVRARPGRWSRVRRRARRPRALRVGAVGRRLRAARGLGLRGRLMRIGLFVTCLTDTLFPDTGRAVVTVLERLGHQVDFPAAQACCGQMHFNTGYRREAVPMVRGMVAAFAGYEAVVSPSASCTSMVREYYPALAGEAGDAALARAVAELVPRTWEL